MKRMTTTLLVAALMATPMLALPPPADAAISVGISVGFAPPALPVYAQPVIPGPGYVWTPGYWAWGGPDGYYWVPGTWVMPPEIGLLWTPGWWGWSDGFYRWNAGYWGTRVGFYGGINYGFGYFGTGYSGGYWRGRDFYYNRAVNNINVTNIRNVYVNRTVVNNAHVNRVSYNGGRGGSMARPTTQQTRYASERRYSPTSMQTQQREAAMRNPAQRFSANRGRPTVVATQRPGQFDGPHAVRSPSGSRGTMTAAPNRVHSVVTAPHARAAASPSRGRGVVEAPRNRVQPARLTSQPPRTERATPVSGHGYTEPNPTLQRSGFNGRPSDNKGPRNASERGGSHTPPPAHSTQGGKAHAKKDKQQNGQHR